MSGVWLVSRLDDQVVGSVWIGGEKLSAAITIIIAVVGLGIWLLTRIGERSKNVAQNRYSEIERQQERLQ